MALGAIFSYFCISSGVIHAGSVTGVGANDYNQITPPTLNSPKAVVAGREFSLALQSDGTVACWGRPGRTNLPAGLSGVVALSAGIFHTLALKSDGTVTGWGYNGNGILSIPSGLNNVLAVAAGGYHSLALRKDGTVVAWGFKGHGLTAVPANLVDVVAIEAGRDFSLALKADGTVVAWGLDDVGQTEVPAGLSNVVAIAAGENHSLALKNDGTVVAWGLNDANQSTVPSGLTGVVAISAGAKHSLALKSNGTVVSWGDNSQGQLSLSGSDVRSIAAGGFDSLALHGNWPLITSQPRGQSTLAGGTITLSATASGTGLTYQWQLNGQDIPGATDPTLTLTNVGRANAGNYTVKITGPGGTIVSTEAPLLVRGRLKSSAPQRLNTGAMRLTFADEFGDPISDANATRYQVQVSNDLQTWTTINQPVSIVNGALQVDDNAAGQFTKRFYRATAN